MKPEPNRNCEARASGIHGSGLFALRQIRKGARIIEYLGEKISKEESDRRGVERMKEAEKSGGGSVYVFELDDETDLDGAFEWNLARLANHSCSPNCEAQNIDGRIWILALRTIRPGEELTFDYGYDISFYEDHPCRCGSPDCVGYIVRRDQWPELKSLLKKQQDEAEAGDDEAESKSA